MNMSTVLIPTKLKPISSTLNKRSNKNNNIINDNQILCVAYPHKFFDSQIVFQSIQTRFSWLPINNIMKTFDETTQCYQQLISTCLLKRYKSPFYTCNVQRLNEPITTDIVYSNTLAICSGCKYAQLFVGTKKMVTNVCSPSLERNCIKVCRLHIQNGKDDPTDTLIKYLSHTTIWPLLYPILFWIGGTLCKDA